MSDVLVVIPTYNEIDNVSLMIEKIFSLSKDFHILIVDDVLTTGGSFEEFTDSYFRNRDPRSGYFGWVVFARRKPQDWITPLFQMPRTWADDPNNLEYHK